MKLKDLNIPFIKDLKIDEDKIIDALLLPANISKTAFQLYKLLGESTNNSNQEKTYGELYKLHCSCFNAKDMSLNSLGEINYSININSLIEYKALQLLTEKYSPKDFNTLIDSYVKKSINENNGVIIQNHYKNLAFLVSDIGSNLYPSDDIRKINLERTNNEYLPNKNFPIKPKQQIEFICSSLENIDPSTLSSMQSFIGLKINVTKQRIEEQNQELDEDLKHLHEKGFTNIKKEDLRGIIKVKQIENILKNHQVFEQAINNSIAYNNIKELCNNINNSELTQYIESLGKAKITIDLVGTIKEGYRLGEHQFSPAMEYRQEEKAHEEYQVLSIIQKDERRQDKVFKESIYDGSLFKSKDKPRFSFKR